MFHRLRGALAAVLAATILCGPIHAQAPPTSKVIRKISIQGLKRESEADVLSRLKIRIGDVFEATKVGEETGNLYRMNKFRSVEEPRVLQVEDGFAVTFVVVERPRVSAVVFEGRAQLSQKHLTTDAPSLQTKAGQLLNDAYLSQDRETVLDKYREGGFIFAQVDVRTAETPEGVKVTFTVEEGSRVRIREVRFSGNKVVSSGTLLGLMETRERFWLFGLLRPGNYDGEVLEADLVRLEQYYQRLGYFDARAQLEGMEFDPLVERLRVDVLIREGPSYTFRGFDVTGNKVFSTKTLLDLTSATPGQPFDAGVIDRDQKAITDYYYDRAYVFAKVKPDLDFSLEGRDVRVKLSIEENAETRIGEVRIEGNERVQDRVIRRELEFYPGEKVDWSSITRSKSNLNRLLIFQNVDVSFEGGATPEEKDLVVKVKEVENFGNFTLGFGLTSGLGIMGYFRLLKRNFDITDLPTSFSDIPDAFTGAGQTLVLTAQPGTDRSLYTFSLTEPYLFGTRNALTLYTANMAFKRERHLEERLTFAPRLSHTFEFDRDFVFSLGYRLEQIQISDVQKDAPRPVKEVEGYNTLSGISAEVKYDTILFEYLEGPYDGTTNSAYFEHTGGALGGSVATNKLDVTNEFYFPIFTQSSGPDKVHHIVSIQNHFGLIEPHDGEDDVPVFERFYLGGTQTVRGFSYRGLGPHERGAPVGGTGMLWGNVEYSLPVVPQVFGKLLRGVAFFDYGDLSPTISSFTFSEMRLSVGGGLRINVPLPGQSFPVNLYYGVPLRKERLDVTRYFLFNIGSPF